MSAQQLSEKNVGRWARRLELPIVAMWSHGGYWLGFVTEDHRHGSVNCKSATVEWSDDVLCYFSCRERFPDRPVKPGPPPDTDEARRHLFALAKERCLTGHTAAINGRGCTYGGMTVYSGYWLAAEGCSFNHGERCDFCGEPAETGFAGREDTIYIWAVAACGPCAQEWLRLEPGWAKGEG